MRIRGVRRDVGEDMGALASFSQVTVDWTRVVVPVRVLVYVRGRAGQICCWIRQELSEKEVMSASEAYVSRIGTVKSPFTSILNAEGEGSLVSDILML